MKKLAALVVVVSVVTLAGFWGGRALCLRMWPGSVNPQQAWYAGLDLDREQRAEFQRLSTAFQQDAEQRCMTICKERLKLLELMRNVPQSREAIYGKIDEIGQLQVALERDIATHILDVSQQLSPEQSQRYFDRVQQELHHSMRRSGYVEGMLH